MKKNSLFAVLAAASLSLVADAALARDYILAPARPNKLILIDAEKLEIERVITLDDDAGPLPITPTLSPDKKFAYVSINKTESLAKVDLDTGETVARIDLSTADERVKTLFGVALSPDGKTLAAYTYPVKLMPSHFEAQPTRITYYDADTLEEKYTFEAPRQITLLMFSTDGTKLYGMGRSMFTFDAETGKELESRPITGWGEGSYAPPDVLSVWSQYDTSNVVMTPFYTARIDKDPDNPEPRTGMLTLDLETDEMHMRDIREMDVFYFSTAVSPDKTRGYGAYNVLESFDLVENKPIKRVDLPHSYYTVNVSSDGKTVYLSGALGNIAAYDTETLERKADLDLPDGASMSLSSVRLFSRED